MGTNDTICDSDDKRDPDRKCFTYSYLTYDFNNSAAREAWVQRVTNITSTGFVDGAFVDGNRGGWFSSVTGACAPEKRQGWADGLKQAVITLQTRLGPKKTLISNYPTAEALAVMAGGMMERGGSSEDIQKFGKKTCGLYNQSCLLDYHAQYFARPEDGKLASFLLGAQKYSYFGGGSGWGGSGPNACALWLKMWPEFSKPLGEPNSDMVLKQASFPGAVCDMSGTKRANTSGCLFTRTFKSGTKVFVGQYLAPDKWERWDDDDEMRPKNRGSCIYWSDGTTTTDNVTNCMPMELIE